MRKTIDVAEDQPIEVYLKEINDLAKTWQEFPADIKDLAITVTGMGKDIVGRGRCLVRTAKELAEEKNNDNK